MENESPAWSESETESATSYGLDPTTDEILNTLQLMIEAGDITEEEAVELFRSGLLHD